MQVQSLEEAIHELEAELGITTLSSKMSDVSSTHSNYLDIRAGENIGGRYGVRRALKADVDNNLVSTTTDESKPRTQRRRPEKTIDLDDPSLPEGLRASSYRLDNNDRVSFPMGLFVPLINNNLFLLLSWTVENDNITGSSGG